MEKNPYLRLVAAVLFAALCAYVGAALYPRLASAGAVPAMAENKPPAVLLKGIALRRETVLSIPEGSPLFARDGDRLSADSALAAMAGDSRGENPGSCVFLACCDGLEYLSVEAARPLTVDCVRALLEARPEDSEGDGRLVAGFDWYYAALTDYKGALPKGKYSLRFEGFGESVKGRLVEVSRFESGERALLFRLTAGDAEYLRLRHTAAELILPG